MRPVRIWREVREGLRTLLRRREAERDLSDELRHFLDAARADLESRGATPEEARRAVRLRYGDPMSAREEVRGHGWEACVDTLIADVRLSARSLRRSPGFTVVVVLTLGLGVGATTAIFSAVGPVLFEPLDYPAADRLVSVADRGDRGELLQVTFGTYRELVERGTAFAAMTVFKPWEPTLTGDDEPARLEGQAVTASYFDVLGVAPVLGPGFDAAQDRPGGDRQVLISHGLWQEHFGASTDVVGRIVHLDGAATTVTGVMPEDLENVTAPRARLWTLLQYDPLLVGFDTREWGHHLGMVGRLRPGVDVAEAGSELDQIARMPVDERARPAWADMAGGFAVTPLKEAVTADVKPTMLLLLGAVALLIIVTCANLTIVLLARGLRRRSEFAVRRALGATRPRLVRYLVTEGLLLAGLGGALGVVVARVGLTTLIAVAPPSLPRIATIEVAGSGLVLALAVTSIVGIVFGLAPGLHRGEATAPTIHEAGRGTIRRSRRTLKALVVLEVALASVLLVGAGLVLRSTQRLFSQPLGLDPSGVAVLQVSGTGLERGDAVTHGFFDEALDAARRVPGVTAVAMTSQLPLSGDLDTYGVVPDDPEAVEGALGPAMRYAVSPGYLETMGVRLVRGRALEEGDVAGSPPVAVVSNSLARRLFPGEDPLGRRIRVGAPELEPYTVVGVVDDVKHGSLADAPSQAVYVTTHQWHWADRVRWMVVRSAVEPSSVIGDVRRAIWSADPNQPVVRAQSMRELVALSEARRRFALILLSAFALSALTVSAVGLFGVLSGMVAERTREMGVRAALGASRERIVSMVVRQGLGLATLGTALGLLGAVVGSGVLRTMLFEISRFDPLTYVVVAALVGAGAAVAAAMPAVRAGRADPVEALRAE